MMRTFKEMVDEIRWGRGQVDRCWVGYFDRVLDEVLEIPLAEFIGSEIPDHRARYLRIDDELVWDRRKHDDD